MRLLIDSLIALMLACILGGVLIHHREEQWRVEALQQVHEALGRLHEQAVFRGALGEVECSSDGFPLILLPEWFGTELPLNYAVSARQPWIDVAPVDDLADQPPDPVITTTTQASFWYNPNRGIFRARVLPQVSNQQTLLFYNQLNGTVLKSLPRFADESRRPKPQPIMTSAMAAAAEASGQDPDHDVTSGAPSAHDASAAPADGSLSPRPTLNQLLPAH